MIDRDWIGRALPTARLKVEPGRLAFFATSIGDKKRTESAPQEAPPTFLFSAYTDHNIYFDLLDRMEIPHQRLLHGEQNFEYLSRVLPGDEIRVEGRIDAIDVKRNGALEFVRISSDAFNQRNETVARLCAVLVIRNPTPV